jgi:glycosyltransferase involved in cell wall biosynthesis
MPSDPILLTVAIPTFNRPDQLTRCVELLRAQTDKRFKLLILDNASSTPAALAIKAVTSDWPELDLRVIRHSINVGGDANILRCFEICETEYLWVLGDDDDPLPTAIETILSTIQANHDLLFCNFACELYARSTESASKGLDEFIASIDSYSNVLFISTSVFRRNAVVQFLPWAYHYMYSMASHLVLLLLALQSQPGTCLLLQSRIVQWNLPPNGISWSGVRQLLGLGILLDLPLSARGRRRLAYLATSPRALEYITVQLLAFVEKAGDRQRAYHVFDQIRYRLLRQSGRRTIGVRFFFYRHFLFRFPALGIALFRLFARIAGRGAMAFDFRDPFR